MRCRYYEPGDPAEEAARHRVERATTAFWDVYTRHFGVLSPAVGAPPGATVLAELGRAIEAIHGDLRLEVTAAGAAPLALRALDDDLAPLIDLVVERGPSSRPLVSKRPPEGVDSALESTLAVMGVDLVGARVRVGVARGHALDLTLHHPTVVGAADDSRQIAAEELCARVLGDDVFDTWVGSVSVAPLVARRPGGLSVVGAPAAPETLALDELVPVVERAVLGIDGNLSERPYHEFCEMADWTMLELGADDASPDAPLGDLVQATTLHPEMLKSYLVGIPFSSRRFSRTGEHFCVLTVRDDAVGPFGERAALRIELEDALSRALVPGRVGAVVGAGVGTLHSYIVFALVDLDGGIDLVRRVYVECQRDAPAWLTFCDTAWRREWVWVGGVMAKPPLGA